MTRIPLMSRPLDLVYFIFFLVHIPATLLIDLQALYPPAMIPEAISALPRLYVDLSNDPLIGGILGILGERDHYLWFKSFLMVEAFFQLPVFFLGAYGLWKGTPATYTLLLIYAASTTTTVLPCLMILFTMPATSPQTIAEGVVSLTFAQRSLLLSSYIPFALIPLVMTFDMALRLSAFTTNAMTVAKAEKSK